MNAGGICVEAVLNSRLRGPWPVRSRPRWMWTSDPRDRLVVAVSPRVIGWPGGPLEPCVRSHYGSLENSLRTAGSELLPRRYSCIQEIQVQFIFYTGLNLGSKTHFGLLRITGA